VERASFAAVVGVATVWAGHAAGTWAAVRLRATTLVRAGVPVALAVLAVAVTAFMAALRVAYVDHPPIDPGTGLPAPSPLSAAGIPGLLLWIGVAAVQLIFFAITVLHTAHEHNPRMQVLQAARSRRRRLLRRHARHLRRWIAATHYATFTTTHAERTEEHWEAKRAERDALFDQRLARYASTAAREMHDPDATVAWEARLARSDASKRASLARTARLVVRPDESRPDITRSDDIDQPPDRVA
jgi:hypothetical protein